jgi:flagellar biosynthetic protein FlhB
MAEGEMGDKTEAPTPRRRQEARDAGTIARSGDLVSSVTLISVLLLLKSFGTDIIGALRAIMQDFMSPASMSDFGGKLISVEIVRATIVIFASMAPIFLGIMACAILINLYQTGIYFNLHRIQPNFAALNPSNGFFRLFSFQGPNFAQTGMNIVKMVVVGLTAYSAISGKVGTIVNVQELTFMQIFGLGAVITYDIALRIGVLLLVLAVFDYAYQRWHIEQELKMSKAEIKEEMKRMDGDPRVKARRKQIAIQRHKERLKKTVPKADVVITNPTHFAVALQYEADKMRAPRVIAKGQDEMARRIRELAAEHGIPIVERAPLARALYRMCDVGDEIPEQFYSAVAEILAYVYELNRKAGFSRAVA